MKLGRKLLGTAAAAGLSALFAAPVEAASLFDFVPAQSNYEVAPGGQVSVQIFMRERFERDSILIQDDGLSSSETLIQRTGSGLVDPAVITSAEREEANFDFFSDESSVSVGGDRAIVQGVRDFEAGSGTGSLQGAGTSERLVSIGFLTILAGSVLGETTTFQTSDNPGDERFNFTWGRDSDDAGTEPDSGTYRPLDEEIDPFTFTITTTPEPAGVSLIVAAGVFLLRRGRYSRV
jgi:hypothetical protein